MRSFLLVITLISMVSFLTAYVMVIAFQLNVNSVEYTMEEKDFVRTELELRIHKFDTPHQLQATIVPYLEHGDHHLRHGFSVWSLYENKCDIFVVEPTKDEDFNTWGHELAHCVYGNWHSSIK